MKVETMIYDRIRPILPNESDRTIFFVSVTQTSYEVFFYAFIDEKPMQCYSLAEEGKLNGRELDLVFAEIVEIIKESELFYCDKNNIATICVDRFGVSLSIEYHEKNARMYTIKKEWEKKHLQN